MIGNSAVHPDEREAGAHEKMSQRSVLRHIVENDAVQAEAMANTAVDFNASPTIAIELEEAIYASGVGRGAGNKALLQVEDLAWLAQVLIDMGLHARACAAATAAAGGLGADRRPATTTPEPLIGFGSNGRPSRLESGGERQCPGENISSAETDR